MSAQPPPPEGEPLQVSSILLAMRDHVSSEIERIVVSIIKSVVEGKQPFLEHPRPHHITRNAIPAYASIIDPENFDLPGGIKTTLVEFGKPRSKKKFALQMHLMSKVYAMVQKGQTCTKRDLFYENVSLYGTQQTLDTGLNNLCLILKVPRDGLCVEASVKGLVAGSLSFTDADGRKVDVSSFRSGILIPSFVDGLRDIKSNAQFIIVVEKDAIFQRLIGEDIFASLGPIILITGKGYPDEATRKLVRKLHSELNLKVFVLVDCDPHGVEIAAIYRWGSYNHENLQRCVQPEFRMEMRVPHVIWLGLLPSEILALNLNMDASATLTDQDRKKLTDVENRLEAEGDHSWIEELNILKGMTKKLELEALFSCPKFATEVYLKRKLQIYFQSLDRF